MLCSVGELVAKLQQLDQTKPIGVYDPEWCEIDAVSDIIEGLVPIKFRDSDGQWIEKQVHGYYFE